MTTQELTASYTAAMQEMTRSGSDIRTISMSNVLIPCFTLMFNNVPNVFTCYGETYEESIGTDILTMYSEVGVIPIVDGAATVTNIMKAYEGRHIVKYTGDVAVIIAENLIIIVNQTCNSYNNGLSVYTLDNEIPKEIADLIVLVPKTDTRYMHYVIHDSEGFTTKRLEVKSVTCDISKNYNDDLPYDVIKQFINSDESGIVVLHGIPGSGKSFLIRNLIYDSEKQDNFLFLDSSTFSYITDSTFLDLLFDHKNAVIVLEDCETLLADRSHGNGLLASLLNLSDGILGDSLNLKFICTFNSDLTKIDQAILRKGRLKIKYEFKKLNSEKVQLLAKDLGKNIPENTELALCDIYNYGDDNGATINNKKPIGFY